MRVTRTTYIGRHEFNRSSPKSGRSRLAKSSRAEVPPLIDQGDL